MAYDDLLIHSVTITTPTGVSGTTRYGDDVPSTTSVVELVRIQHLPGVETSYDEFLQGRDVRVGGYRMFAKANSTVTSLSTVTWGTKVFRVRAQPTVVDDSTGPHHVEAILELVEGL